MRFSLIENKKNKSNFYQFSYDLENYRHLLQKNPLKRDEKLAIYIYIFPKLNQLKNFLKLGFELPSLKISLSDLSKIVNISSYLLKKNFDSFENFSQVSFWELEKLLSSNNLKFVFKSSLDLISSYFLILNINSHSSSLNFIENFFKKFHIPYIKEETLWGIYIRILAKIPKKIFILLDDSSLIDLLIEILKWPIRAGIIKIYIIKPSRFFHSKVKAIRTIYTLNEKEWKKIVEE